MRPTTRTGRGAVVLGLLGIVALLWTLAPGARPVVVDPAGVAATLVDIGAGVITVDGVITDGHAVPARVASHERSGIAEHARAWASTGMVAPLVAVMVLCLVVGSTGLPGAGTGWSTARRGRAPPMARVVRPVR